jgi:hypothetical protein
MQKDKNHDDFDLESFGNSDDFGDLFDDSMSDFTLPDETENVAPPSKPLENKKAEEPVKEPLFDGPGIDIPHKDKPAETLQRKKRTISDFEPDMDALLLTAQSSMIIEGMQHCNNRNYSSDNLPIFLEALKGIDLYTKILNRNPGNYRKLKTLIDADNDCQQVEKIAFDLYRKEYDTDPDSDRQKLEAFELFRHIFKKAMNKSSISRSMKIIKKYFLLSGGIDIEKIKESAERGDIEIKRDVTSLQQHLRLAIEILKKGDGEITKGLRGRDLNVYITKTSEFLGTYYQILNNAKISDYFFR